MIQSMTSFAARSFTVLSPHGQEALITLHLKTLNARFFETVIKLSHVFVHLETKIVTLLKQQLKRGTVTLLLHVDNKNLFKGTIQPDLSTAQSYLDAISTVQNRYNIPGVLTIADLISLENIFVTHDEPLDESIENHILFEVEKLIQDVVKLRLQEGAALGNDLRDRIVLMRQEINFIHERSQLLMHEQKEKIGVHAALISDAQQADSLHDQRRMVLFTALDKMDIHEELFRFNNHLDNVHAFLDDPGMEKGKRLDFTLQELGREINTITSKCADSVIARHAINIKVEIEKAREQAQNIV